MPPQERGFHIPGRSLFRLVLIRGWGGVPRSMGSGTPACAECFVILGLGELEVTLLEMLKVASSGSAPALALHEEIPPASVEQRHR